MRTLNGEGQGKEKALTSQRSQLLDKSYILRPFLDRSGHFASGEDLIIEGKTLNSFLREEFE